MPARDLNSRTVLEQDFVIFDNDIDLDLLPDDYEADEICNAFYKIVTLI